MTIPIATAIDPQTAQAVNAFLEGASRQFPVRDAVLFGSRARGTAHLDSDADVAVVLHEPRGSFMQTKLQLADIAFDTMLDTGIRIQALPIWESEWSNPDWWRNPELLHNVKRTGIRVWHPSPA